MATRLFPVEAVTIAYALNNEGYPEQRAFIDIGGGKPISIPAAVCKEEGGMVRVTSTKSCRKIHAALVQVGQNHSHDDRRCARFRMRR